MKQAGVCYIDPHHAQGGKCSTQADISVGTHAEDHYGTPSNGTWHMTKGAAEQLKDGR